MITIRFIQPDGTVQTLEAEPGQSLMKAAVDANLPGIEADCGGSLTCATCHVMIGAPWSALLPAPVPDETDMLDFASSPVVPESRLSCQVRLTPELDGMEVRLPASQH
ncbi:MAG: 2Fe-2S iron-sulfur cluster-binding protein [Hydrogenophaga sp.]|jgi:2Fe-2S ferredoxin|uniref:2Fe-2S iron-sulfur cluster-binding protein n=1 Tax=Hydrogenophaga sp. TaxID=1904254 RepID=UPI001D82725E|nr:2Fe-2S iron-sulfur cluster-binding protein [Hydrogenophaga sp.]MBW0172762.1 2Fe-2S iron-sulfur cluster binding domain-containing protein [Hydrogenophaga sp.]MBW0185680.1 2Fe-2S iron-sulfur cluster binding domain-containing protein [Hydrogenophaga sp.]